MHREFAKVLVVDDNEANRALARGTLEDEGYEVVLAADGAEGLVAFESEQPDCVLLDVRMPNVDGLAACERLRRLPRGDEIPIIFLTAHRDIDTFDRALRAGGDDFLTKPFRPAELVVRVQAALKLRRMGAELREHCGLLKQQRDDLLRLQLQKERLMAFVVHDLKNPVNAMDLHAQLLLRDESLSSSAKDSATQIRAEARQLTRMILNLLDVSRADEGQLVAKTTTFDPRPLVDETVAELRASAESRSVLVETDIGVERLSADPELLRRMLSNLVENAIRHAPHGSSVRVSVERASDAALLRVADQGPGIPIDMRERVFEPFVQVEAGERVASRGSRGLGLTFCRRAAAAHGGSIVIEERAVGNGTTFCVRLPDVP